MLDWFAHSRGVAVHAAWLNRAALALLCLLSACQPAADRAAVEAPASPQLGGTLRILHEPTESLDPLFTDDVYEGTVGRQLFEGLVLLDANLSPRPGLAESWTISDDGCRYRFNLRSNVQFHDGTPLDAATVTRSLTLVLRPDKPQPCLAETYLAEVVGAREFIEGRASSVRGLSAIDARTVEIDLVRPLSFFLAVLAMNQTAITPAREGETWAERAAHPIGTGPFRFARRTVEGSVALARNDEYWSVPAYLDSLYFHAETPLTPERSVALLLRGVADGGSISTSQQSLMAGPAGFHVQSVPELSLTFLGLNTNTPPLDRLEVRQAIAHSIDVVEVLKGKKNRLVVAQGILPPGMPGYRPEERRPKYDLDQARRLLRSVGISPDHPAATLPLYTTRVGSRGTWLRRQLASDLRDMGLPIEVIELDWSDLDARVVAGKAPLFTMTWVADVPDPDAFLYFLFQSGESNNLFGLHDAEIDSLLARGRALPPGAARFEVYSTIEDRVLAALPCIPLYHDTSAYTWDPTVEGIECSPFGQAQTVFARAWFNRPAHNSPMIAGIR